MQEMEETWAGSLDRENPLEEEMATHSSILAWRIPRTEEPGGLHSPRSFKESDRTERPRVHMNRGRTAAALTSKDEDRAARSLGLRGGCGWGLGLKQLDSSRAPGESAGVRARAAEEAEFHTEWEAALVASVVRSSAYTVVCSVCTQ